MAADRKMNVTAQVAPIDWLLHDHWAHSSDGARQAKVSSLHRQPPPLDIKRIQASKAAAPAKYHGQGLALFWVAPLLPERANRLAESSPALGPVSFSTAKLRERSSLSLGSESEERNSLLSCRVLQCLQRIAFFLINSAQAMHSFMPSLSMRTHPLDSSFKILTKRRKYQRKICPSSRYCASSSRNLHWLLKQISSKKVGIT
jgi:hypothetical protein